MYACMHACMYVCIDCACPSVSKYVCNVCKVCDVCSAYNACNVCNSCNVCHASMYVFCPASCLLIVFGPSRRVTKKDMVVSKLGRKKSSFHAGIADNGGRVIKVARTVFGLRQSRARREPNVVKLAGMDGFRYRMLLGTERCKVGKHVCFHASHAARHRTLLSWPACMLSRIACC